MARANSGSLHTRSLADGTRVFRLRFNAVGRRELMSLHERPGCDCGCGGGWDEPAARRELGDAIARVRLGVWKRPTAASRKRRAGTGTSFEEYALRWLQAKTDGLLARSRLPPRPTIAGASSGICFRSSGIARWRRSIERGVCASRRGS